MNPKSIKNRTKIDQKSIKNRSQCASDPIIYRVGRCSGFFCFYMTICCHIEAKRAGTAAYSIKNSVQGTVGPPKPSQNRPKIGPKSVKNRSCGRLGAALGPLGPSGPRLGPSWGILRPSWSRLGPQVGPRRSQKGAKLGPDGAQMAPSWHPKAIIFEYRFFD